MKFEACRRFYLHKLQIDQYLQSDHKIISQSNKSKYFLWSFYWNRYTTCQVGNLIHSEIYDIFGFIKVYLLMSVHKNLLYFPEKFPKINPLKNSQNHKWANPILHSFWWLSSQFLEIVSRAERDKPKFYQWKTWKIHQIFLKQWDFF